MSLSFVVSMWFLARSSCVLSYPCVFCVWWCVISRHFGLVQCQFGAMSQTSTLHGTAESCVQSSILCCCLCSTQMHAFMFSFVWTQNLMRVLIGHVFWSCLLWAWLCLFLCALLSIVQLHPFCYHVISYLVHLCPPCYVCVFPQYFKPALLCLCFVLFFPHSMHAVVLTSFLHPLWQMAM